MAGVQFQTQVKKFDVLTHLKSLTGSKLMTSLGPCELLRQLWGPSFLPSKIPSDAQTQAGNPQLSDGSTKGSSCLCALWRPAWDPLFLGASWVSHCCCNKLSQTLWLKIKIYYFGLPWWCSCQESACQWRGHGFEPWSGKIPHATEQLSLCTTTTEPAL